MLIAYFSALKRLKFLHPFCQAENGLKFVQSSLPSSFLCFPSCTLQILAFLVITLSPSLVYFMKYAGNRLLKWGFFGVITGTEATNLWHHKCAGRDWFNWKEAEKPNKMEVSNYLDLGCWLDQWMYEVILDWRAHVSSCPTELWNLSLSRHYCTVHGNSFPIHCSPRNCIYFRLHLITLADYLFYLSQGSRDGKNSWSQRWCISSPGRVVIIGRTFWSLLKMFSEFGLLLPRNILGSIA